MPAVLVLSTTSSGSTMPPCVRHCVCSQLRGTTTNQRRHSTYALSLIVANAHTCNCTYTQLQTCAIAHRRSSAHCQERGSAAPPRVLHRMFGSLKYSTSTHTISNSAQFSTNFVFINISLRQCTVLTLTKNCCTIDVPSREYAYLHKTAARDVAAHCTSQHIYKGRENMTTTLEQDIAMPDATRDNIRKFAADSLVHNSINNIRDLYDLPGRMEVIPGKGSDVVMLKYWPSDASPPRYFNVTVRESLY